MFRFRVKVEVRAGVEPGNLNGGRGNNCFPRQHNILHFRCMENFARLLTTANNTNRTRDVHNTYVSNSAVVSLSTGLFAAVVGAGLQFWLRSS